MFAVCQKHNCLDATQAKRCLRNASSRGDQGADLFAGWSPTSAVNRICVCYDLCQNDDAVPCGA